ncbi:MAG TPA: NADH-quinone oxidoreductase subunit J [Actinomycetales bacterium]|jgi:NADH-quinone oxidoreductase subunit J
MTTRDVLFTLVGLIAAASGLLAVLSRQVVHAALWLVTALGAIAGCYLVMGAEVVALVQVLVYLGAIVVLVLFALMLTRAPIGFPGDLDAPWPQRLAAAVAGAATTGLLVAVLVTAVRGRTIDVGTAAAGARSQSQPLATSLFGSWVLPFELLSLLLLAALVGALVLSREPTAASPPPAAPTPAGPPVEGDHG